MPDIYDIAEQYRRELFQRERRAASEMVIAADGKERWWVVIETAHGETR